MTVDTNDFPIFQTAARANPQAVYETMREKQPVFSAIGPQSGNRIWFMVNYDDVVAVLKDQRFVKDVRKNVPQKYHHKYLPEIPNPAFEAIDRHLLNLDAPDHTRLRALVHKAFTPARVNDLKPRIEAIADALLDDMADKHEVDLIDAYAFPLPITVIAEMLGINKDDREKFREWTKVLLFGMDEEEAAFKAMEFMQYMNELIEERRQTDTGDILSALVQVEQDGDSLDHMELLAMIFLLLVAGHETTVNLIGNGMLALMTHPDQMQKLQANPGLMPGAVEEMLRYNGPVETPTPRFASQDVVVNGVTITEGDVVLPSLLAANRDPKVFQNPNTFDITRSPNPHVAFGHGIHYCLGAPLARMEGNIAISKLLSRYPNIQLNVNVADLEWTPSLLIHGMKALPVRY